MVCEPWANFVGGIVCVACDTFDSLGCRCFCIIRWKLALIRAAGELSTTTSICSAIRCVGPADGSTGGGFGANRTAEIGGLAAGSFGASDLGNRFVAGFCAGCFGGTVCPFLRQCVKRHSRDE